MHWHVWHGVWFLFPLFWISLLALLIWGVRYWLNLRNSQVPPWAPEMPPFGMPPTRSSALEILRQRYARGEIDATTFEQMRERLASTDRPKYE